MNPKEMADLFDEVEISDKNGDKNGDEKGDAAFEEQIDDIQAIMESEEAPFDDDEGIIENAFKDRKKKVEDEVESDMKEFEVEEEPEAEASEETPSKEEAVIEEESDAEEEIPDTPSTKADTNPLGLSSSDLSDFQDVKKKLPQFVLYDGSVSFKDFYRYKFNILRQVVGRFPILNLKQIGEEIGRIDIDHFVGNMTASPELIQRKLDNSYAMRARLSSLMLKILEQQPSWERWCELLKAKLWKDHEMKGTHRRDGLTLEHMADMEDYVHYMRGVMDSAKHVDNMLKAAAESLSRQLNCLQLKEPTGFKTPPPADSKLDELDSFSGGEKVEARKEKTRQFVVDEDDDFL